MLDLLIFATVFLTSFTIFFILIHFTFFRDVVKERVRRISDKSEREGPLRFKRLRGFAMEFIKGIGPIGSPKEEEKLSRTQKRLIKAGYRGKNDHIIFYGLKTFLAILIPCIFLPLSIGWIRISFLQGIFIFVLLATLGFYLPNVWIHLRTKKRRERISKGFPDFLDLLVVCVEAGQGLDAALNKVGREIEMVNKVLGEELRLLNLEIKAGKYRREALRNLALRTDLEDISSFVALINQAEEFGTSIASTLRVHSDFMRTRRHQRAEEMAAKLPVKMLFPLIFFIMPSLFVVLLGPALINVIRTIIQEGVLK